MILPDVSQRVGDASSYPFLDHDGPIAFAHRGGALYEQNVGLENSRAAFARAVDMGYRYLETDVHATRDGVLLAFHDRSLDRVTDQTGLVESLPYEEVSVARIGGTEPIPRLIDLLQEWPQVRLNVDVKNANAIGPLARLVTEHDLWDRLCIASFSGARIRRIRALLGSRVATSLGPVGVAALRLAPVPRLRERLLRAPVPCVQVPVRARGIPIVTPRFVDRAHVLGKHVHAWTVDDAAEMTRLLDMGVDGIMTDRIDTLREVLQSRGQWPADGTEARQSKDPE